jgi:GAF domain-containing protein
VLALRPDLADSLALVARELNAPRDLATTLHTIVEVAARSLPGIDHVGITLAHSTGEMETRAATDEFAWKLDRLQVELGEGPLVGAIEGKELVLIENATDDSRWPLYLKPAVATGLRSQLGIRLCADEQTLGWLNLYSSSTDTVDPDVVHLAELFAEHAALALGRAQREDQLQAAITTRQLIGQATGIIMERHALDDTRAFEHLVRVSSHSNVKLRDVARELVDEANGKADPRAEALSHDG